MVSPVSSSALQSHWQGAKQAISGDIQTIKQHPVASAALMAGTVLASRRFPKIAAAANVGLATGYALEVGHQELAAHNAPDALTRQNHYVKAGDALLNLGLTGIGLPSAWNELAGKAKQLVTGAKATENAATSWKTIAALADDSLIAVNALPGNQKPADAEVTVNLAAVDNRPLIYNSNAGQTFNAFG